MDSKSSTKDLMSIQNLAYELPADISLAMSGGVLKKNSADQNSYTNTGSSEIVFTVQSSQDFVYGRNCYLRFDVKAAGLATTGGDDVALGFLNSPATALFERVLIESRDGAELERIDDLNKMVRNCLPWKYPEDYRLSAEMAGQKFSKAFVNNGGAFTGAETVADFALNTPQAVGTGSDLRVVIPLWYFSGLFSEETLLPPTLTSGMRIRLTLAPIAEAISIIGTDDGKATIPGYTAAALTYTITDPVIMCDSYTLEPTVMRAIMEQMSSKDGLPYVYESMFAQTANPGTSTSYTLQVNKAVARAQKLWVVTQNTIADSTLVDNLGTKQIPYYQVQTRVGDLYLPQQTLQLGSTDSAAGARRNCAELYAQNLQCTWGMRDPYRDPSVSLQDFRNFVTGSDLAETACNGGFATVVQNLNQSAHVGASGLALNNSRTGEMTIRYHAGATGAKNVVAWLQYVKVAAVYSDRVVVKH